MQNFAKFPLIDKDVEIGRALKDLRDWQVLPISCDPKEQPVARNYSVVKELISIPPKYSVSQVVGFLKGKSAIQIARVYLGKRKNFVGQHFWARGYFVSTVGMNEETIRAYIKAQEKEDRWLDQVNLFQK